MSPMLRGSKLVPSTRPNEAMVTQARGTSVRMIAPVQVEWASTPAAWMTEAMGSTMTAEIKPWMAPERTLAAATSQMGHGAWTRSSISRVNPNSWDICKATGCTPWNMTEIPTTPGMSTVANAEDAAALGVPPLADRLADLGEDVEEDEHREKRLYHGTGHELDQVLPQHHRGPAASAPPGRSGWPTRRNGLASWRSGSGPGGAPARSSSSVAQLPAGEVDEHGLEAGLGHRQVRDLEPLALGRGHQPGEESVPTPTWQLEPASVGLGTRLTSSISRCSTSASPLLVADRLHRHDGPGPHALLEPGGRVEGEEFLPWSMMATRPQSWSPPPCSGW